MHALFDRIVCGVDRTDAALEAVRQARRLGGPESRLLLVSVSDSSLAVHAGALAPKVAAELDDEARRALEEACAGAGDCESRLVHGRPNESLLALLEAERATLVAVGSHEHRRATGIVLGSVATRMLHDAPCSVLLARPPAGAGDFPRTILVGLDGSQASLEATAVADELAGRLGATVHRLVATGGNPLDLDVDRLGTSGLELEYRDARPVAALLEASAELEADLIVVGSRGLDGLRALGSVSERVAHHAGCSLLVVRGTAA
jgi:nucleotide-binding universal stress UspA family protein